MSEKSRRKCIPGSIKPLSREKLYNSILTPPPPSPSHIHNFGDIPKMLERSVIINTLTFPVSDCRFQIVSLTADHTDINVASKSSILMSPRDAGLEDITDVSHQEHTFKISKRSSPPPPSAAAATAAAAAAATAAECPVSSSFPFFSSTDAARRRLSIRNCDSREVRTTSSKFCSPMLLLHEIDYRQEIIAQIFCEPTTIEENRTRTFRATIFVQIARHAARDHRRAAIGRPSFTYANQCSASPRRLPSGTPNFVSG